MPNQADRRRAHLLTQVRRLSAANARLRRAAAEHRRDAAALRANEERLAHIRRSLPMALYTARTKPPFGLSWIGENGLPVTGFPPERFLRRAGFRAGRVHPDDRERVLAAWAGVTHRTATSVEYRWRCADGRYRWFLDQVILLRRRGQPAELLGTWLDITRRKQLQREVLAASEREQRRIGHDLHDDLAQHLASLEMLGRALRQRLAATGSAESGCVDELCQSLREATDKTRTLARGLAPVALHDEGLVAALEQLAARTQQSYRIRCQVRCPRPVEVVSPELANHLYRIAQEAISNAARHARATRIELRLDRAPGQVRLEVRDNGVGLSQPRQSDEGMGLSTMAYRAGLLGASLTMRNPPQGGTRVVVSAPLSPAQSHSSKS